jgi:hypothetical protein
VNSLSALHILGIVCICGGLNALFWIVALAVYLMVTEG